VTTTEQCRGLVAALRRRCRATLAPIVLTAVIGAVSIATPSDVAVSRLLPAAPALAASMWSVGATVGLGVLALAVVAVVALLDHHVTNYFTVAAIAAVTAAAGYASHIRLQRERALLQVRSVAEAAQSVVLRTVPPRIGGMAVETLYVAAAAEARIGTTSTRWSTPATVCGC
jgi:hypothetical protein